MKIGIIREGKVPVDRRVPLNPSQAVAVKETFGVELVVQTSTTRCFPDEQYVEAGIEVVENVDDCDVLLGVKEVPVNELIPGKTYFFFSHTIKMQPYNHELLKTIVENGITLIDYEVITDENNHRLIAFGRFAGIVGAYNGLWTFGKRYNLYHLKRAHECYDLKELMFELERVKLPPVKIVLTGGGRVAKGAMEVFNQSQVRRVSPAVFLKDEHEYPVYTQLNSRDYHIHKQGKEFHRKEFFNHPELFEADFLKYAAVADLFVAGAYWDPASPVLFHRQDVLTSAFGIKVIADITCDIEGSIPSTLKATTIDDPVYDYNPSENKTEPAFSDEANLSVMAVDNLPCEVPRDASTSFGKQLLENVLPEFFSNEHSQVIERATIVKEGNITKPYGYLEKWVNNI
jgi:alanine dehydrogenase